MLLLRRYTYVKQTGFTLVELVAVIVLLGIIGTGSVNFIKQSAEAYRDVTRRDEITGIGRFTVERISRELRTALPGSVRVSGNCLRFVPVVGATFYTDIPVNIASPTFDVIDPAPTLAASDTGDYRVAVYTLQAADVYPDGGRVKTFDVGSAIAVGNVTRYEFSAASNQAFPAASPNASKRLYYVTLPVSFCVATDGKLYRYQNIDYGVTDPSSATAVSDGDLLAEFLVLNDDGSAVTPFQYIDPTLRQNGIVHLDLRFLARGSDYEYIRFRHEVALRGLP